MHKENDTGHSHLRNEGEKNEDGCFPITACSDYANGSALYSVRTYIKNMLKD